MSTPPRSSFFHCAVVPLSVLSNWEKQIADHVKEGALSHCVYYGTGRNMTPEQLKKYDVVITTYQTVAKEHGDLGGRTSLGGPSQKKLKTEKGLFDVPWKVRFERCGFCLTVLMDISAEDYS